MNVKQVEKVIKEFMDTEWSDVYTDANEQFLESIRKKTRMPAGLRVVDVAFHEALDILEDRLGAESGEDSNLIMEILDEALANLGFPTESSLEALIKEAVQEVIATPYVNPKEWYEEGVISFINRAASFLSAQIYIIEDEDETEAKMREEAKKYANEFVEFVSAVHKRGAIAQLIIDKAKNY